MQLLRHPALHFIIIGGALFALLRWLNPPPRPSLGPLPEPRIETLRLQWLGIAARPPSDAQLRALIQSELDRDMLFREALDYNIHRRDPVVRQRLLRNMRFLQLAEGRPDDDVFRDALRMELHLSDEVVKRRMIQVMEQLLLAGNPPPPPQEADIRQAFAERRADLRRPARYSLEHVYLPEERAAELKPILARLRAEKLQGREAQALSAPFLPGYEFNAQSPAQLARSFGTAFARNLQSLNPSIGEWAGPVQSTYGHHLVRLSAIEPERDAALEEARRQLLRDLRLERRREALRQAVAELRADYEVVLQ